MERIHKKLGATLFGRGDGARWVFFEGEACDFQTSVIYGESQILSWVESNQAFGLDNSAIQIGIHSRHSDHNNPKLFFEEKYDLAYWLVQLIW